MIEILRFLAAIAIVCWHVPDGPDGLWITWSLPFFVMLSVIFGQTAPDSPLRRVVLRFARIFLVPWVLWSFLYLGFWVVGNLASLGSFTREFGWLNLLVGGRLPLWYLPFIFVVLSSVATWRKSFATALPTSTPTIVVTRVTLLLIMPVAVIMSQRLFALEEAPFPQYASVIPAALLGLLYLQEFGRAEAKPNRGLIVCVAGVVLMAGTGSAVGWDWRPTGIAFLLVTCFEGRCSTSARLPLAMGRLSWPVYLVHPAFIAVFLVMFTGQSGQTVLVLLSTVVASILASAALLRWPLGRRLLLEGRIRTA